MEQSLRRALALRVSAVRSEPDLADLHRRLAETTTRQAASTGADRPHRPHRPLHPLRLAAAAAALLLAAGAGISFGSVVAPTHTAHAVLSSAGGDEGGALPTGPRHWAPTAAGPPANYSALGLAPAASVTAAGSDGVQLSATGRWLAPFLVAAGTARGCYAGELVTTTARSGGVRAQSLAVAATAPLAATGLEVLAAGARPISATEDLWWATIATGSAVAKLAAEQPDGTTEVTHPVGGIALVGGVVGAGEDSRVFSAVAETAGGQSLNSLGFLPGFGSRAAGLATGASAGRSSTIGCQNGLDRRGSSSTIEARSAVSTSAHGDAVAPGLLQAAAGVVTAFHSAYAPEAITVLEVRMLSGTSAEAIYRIGSGRLRAGVAVLDSSATWQVG
jgi:hypothetical protein